MYYTALFNWTVEVQVKHRKNKSNLDYEQQLCFFFGSFVFFEWTSNSFQTKLVVITVCRRTFSDCSLESKNSVLKKAKNGKKVRDIAQIKRLRRIYGHCDHLFMFTVEVLFLFFVSLFFSSPNSMCTIEFKRQCLVPFHRRTRFLSRSCFNKITVSIQQLSDEEEEEEKNDVKTSKHRNLEEWISERCF